MRRRCTSSSEHLGIDVDVDIGLDVRVSHVEGYEEEVHICK
jgi:hypothetical protein